MKYEAPQVIALTPAIEAVRADKIGPVQHESPKPDEVGAAYADWE